MAASLAIGTALSSASGALKSIPKEVYIIGGGIIATILIAKTVRSAVDKAKYNSAIKAINTQSKTGIATMLATNLSSAFYQAGIRNNWIPDGTNDVLVFQVAKTMFNKQISFIQVSDQYKGLYQRNLLEDLQSELDSNELRTFWELVKTGAPPKPLVNHRVSLNGHEINIKLA
ncbi:hypothetical protein [Aureibacter tunicatorum]|uniref:Uncharacterized protein n=1 Tax=Aureibacter tunicatorum TaxID=866807 RepID=A0AAE4BTS0_9BACT|nr:hypothetical protein [Aureibacter tunicatorum]MDR6239937.1 hypothetical protein [Aureibacter tunicatorum]BDD04411.1 hypothetical protein AUTU_18940 [Aureibacter tunicatorum]